MSVNSNSLVKASSVYSGADLSNLEEIHTLIFPNGDRDDTQYKTRQEALDSLVDADDVMDRVRTIFFEEKWKQDDLHMANHAIENINEIAEELGYKVERHFGGVKK